MVKIRTVAIFITLLFVASCDTPRGAYSNYSLVETYDYACKAMPDEPSCFHSDTSYQRSFNECKQSTENYIAALDRHGECAKNDLRNIFDKLLKEVPKTFKCYKRYFDKHDKGPPTIECPLIKIPYFPQSTSANGVAGTFGLPNCVTDMSPYVAHNFAPKTKYSIKQCGEEVGVFMGRKTNTYKLLMSGAKSAQKQFDDFIINLNGVLSRKSDEAVSKFNCKARGNRIC